MQRRCRRRKAQNLPGIDQVRVLDLVPVEGEQRLPGRVVPACDLAEPVSGLHDVLAGLTASIASIDETAFSIDPSRCG